MALRGRGARAAEKRQKAAQLPTRKPSWKRKGLSRAERVIRFLQSLPITKGHRQGQKMRLCDEQKATRVAVKDPLTANAQVDIVKYLQETGSTAMALVPLPLPPPIEARALLPTSSSTATW